MVKRYLFADESSRRSTGEAVFLEYVSSSDYAKLEAVVEAAKVARQVFRDLRYTTKREHALAVVAADAIDAAISQMGKGDS